MSDKQPQPDESTAVTGTADDGDQVLRVQRIYLKDVSFESPQTPELFVSNTAWKPEVSLHLQTDKQKINEDVYEIVLTLTVTVKSDQQVAYLVELKQAGLFLLRGFDANSLGGLIYSYCPNLLFPFAREAVSSLVMKGGFPQLVLEPINFDALYAQRLQASRQNAPAPQTRQ